MSTEVECAPVMVQELRESFHDMQQPVASMLALTAAALAEPDLPAAARRRLEQIAGQAEWLANMVHGCLVTAGRHEPGEPEEPDDGSADVVHIVSEVIAAECLTWPGDMMLNSPTVPVWCRLHPVLLRRAVANVLGNATRAAGPAWHGDRRDPAAQGRCRPLGGGQRPGFRENTERLWPGIVRRGQKRRQARRKNGVRRRHAWRRTGQPVAADKSRPKERGR